MNFLGTEVSQPTYISESAWLEHGAFSTWLMRRLKPKRMVELGTHYGFSYFAMCEVVASDALDVECFAVDTWLGDEHAGKYGSQVFDAVAKENEQYSSFSKLVRNTFSEAVDDFEDGSIDLLHIDGRHFYEDVKEDFETWQPKLSNSSIVMFHDTQVTERDFGVKQFFAEISEGRPSVDFLHCNGLGVLGWGSDVPQAIHDLIDVTDKPWRENAAQNFFEAAGKITREREKRAFVERNSAGSKRKLAEIEANLSTSQEEFSKVTSDFAAVKDELAKAQAKISTLESNQTQAGQAHSRKGMKNPQLVHLQEQLMASVRKSNEILKRPTRSYLKTRAAKLAAKLAVSSEKKRTKFLRSAAKRDPRAAGTELVKASNQLIAKMDLLVSSKSDAAIKVLEASASSGQQSKLRPETQSFSPFRAVFISGEPVKKPGFRYRIANYATALRALGGTSSEFHISEMEYYQEDIAAADFVFVWRARWSEQFAQLHELTHAAQGTLIYDLDDLMVREDLVDPKYIDAVRYDNKKIDQVKEHYRSVHKALSVSDFASATTEELEWQMKRRVPQHASIVLPNGFDEQSYSLTRASVRKKQQDDDGLIRIGYASGSRTHQKDFELCSEAVADALREHDNARLVLFRSGELVTLDVREYDCFKGLEDKIEWREMVPHSELPTEMARFDINLAPLEFGNPFCEAKSELKFFEAAIADIVTIASPTGPFERCMTHGVSGFLARTHEEWRSFLFELIADADLRRTIGRRAHLDALWMFGTKRRVELMSNLLEALKGERSSAKLYTGPLVNLDNISPADDAFSESDEVFLTGNLQPSRVSIVVTVFNYADKIVDALTSVYEQDLQDIELIVVDDASTDGSLDIVQDWMRRYGMRFNRCVLLKNKENSGLGMSRNNGFREADCAHIMSLDADNKLRPGCCRRLVEEAEGTGAAFAYPIIERFGDKDGFIGGRDYSPAFLKGGNFIDAMALISKEAWAFVGGYTTHRMGWQDYDLWCRFVDKGLFGVHVPEVLADYRVHGSSMLHTNTDGTANKIKLLDWMEEQHPWLSLTSQERTGYRRSDRD